MPATLSYPGVYIEEVPSGVRTITGVATSITAFIGRAKRGPVNKATTITSYSDFE
ncbi:MAG: phage tail sheath family protein, partial [Nitrospinaceae bacterium]